MVATKQQRVSFTVNGVGHSVVGSPAGVQQFLSELRGRGEQPVVCGVFPLENGDALLGSEGAVGVATYVPADRVEVVGAEEVPGLPDWESRASALPLWNTPHAMAQIVAAGGGGQLFGPAPAGPPAPLFFGANQAAMSDDGPLLPPNWDEPAAAPVPSGSGGRGVHNAADKADDVLPLPSLW